MDEMQLHVLPCRNVDNAVRVFLGQFSQHFQLFRIQASIGNLDPLHARGVPDRIGPLGMLVRGVWEGARFVAIMPLSIVIPLPIDSAPQPRFGKDFLIDLVPAAQCDFLFERIDFVGELAWNITRNAVPPKFVTSPSSEKSPESRVFIIACAPAWEGTGKKRKSRSRWIRRHSFARVSGCHDNRCSRFSCHGRRTQSVTYQMHFIKAIAAWMFIAGGTAGNAQRCWRASVESGILADYGRRSHHSRLRFHPRPSLQ